MIRSVPYERRAFLILAVVTLGLACIHPAVDALGVPLYPNGEATRLPRSQIAQIGGPIARVDGQDVMGQGGPFDLLPGCHVVELDRGRLLFSGGPGRFTGTSWNGPFISSTYAIRMKAGARYVIGPPIYTTARIGSIGRTDLWVREEEPSGAMTDRVMAKSAEEIEACQGSTRLMSRQERRVLRP